MASAEEAPPARGGASLILAWNITGKDVLIVGGTNVASERVLYALEADARVTLVSPSNSITSALRSRISRGELTWHAREFTVKDLKNKALVMVAGGEEALSRRVASLSRERGIPVNVADIPELSDFWFMSTYRDHALQVAVSTNGNGPKLATRIRQTIANTLPAEAGLAIQNLSLIRQHLRSVAPSEDSRRADFVARLSESWSFESLAKIAQEDIDRLGDAFVADGDLPAPKRRGVSGILSYVSAGSGDPELLVRGAYKSLLEAALVIGDADIPQEILDLVGGELVVLQHSTGRSQLEDLVLPFLQQGDEVVRLLARDALTSNPAILEEMKLFRDGGYAVHAFPAVISSGPVFEIGLHSSSIPPSVNTSADVDVSAQSFALHAGTVQQINGQTAAAHVAYGLSDLSFIYPVTTGAEVGEVMQKWEKTGVSNAFGNSHKVVSMSTRSGAASAVHGALSTGSSVTAVLSSTALTLMIPSMYEIARARKPVVFHVSAQAIAADTFSIVPDIKSVIAAVYTGFALLSSGTVQEAHDLALVAHVAAQIAQAPFLHFFDGARIASEVTSSKILDYQKLATLVRRSVVEPKKKHFDAATATDEAMSLLAATFGHRYDLFEYAGPTDAEIIVVALGPVAKLAQQAAKHIGGSTGVLTVRLLRPWSAAHFIAALPTSVKKLVVIDQAGGNGGHGPLFLDVTACFYSKAWTGRTPVILTARFSEEPGSYHPAAVEGLLLNAALARPDFDYLITAETVDTDADARYSQDGIHQAVLWDLQETDTVDVAQAVVGYLAEDRLTQVHVSHDDAQIDPVSVSHVRYAQGTTAGQPPTSSYLIHSAEYAAVHDLSLLQRYNVAKSVRSNGILVLNTHLTGENLEKEIPDEVKAEIMHKKLRVKTVDATGTATDFTLFKGAVHQYVTLILTAVFLKLAPEVDFPAAMRRLGNTIASTEPDRSILATKLGAIRTGVASIRDVGKFQHAAVSADAKPLPAIVGNSVPFEKLSLKEDDNEEDIQSRVTKPHEGIWPVLFPEAYNTTVNLRPDIPGAFKVKVTENRRLTPDTYDRNVFHLEMDIKGTGMKYEIGEALGVHGHNDPVAVEKFLTEYGVNPNHIVYVDRRDEQSSEIRTAAQMFTQIVDVFGRPGRKFYQALLGHTRDPLQHEEVHNLLSNSELMTRFVEEETPTYADLLAKFTSARPTVEQLLNLIPAIKPRHYSISSAQSMHPDSVHLLVVLVDWKTKSGSDRYGQCTRYLLSTRVGDTITVTLKPSVMKLPKSLTAPVVMSGLGTGMAPFRAFIQERAHWKSLGHEVGPMTLYFGARFRGMEYLYGEEMEAYHADGVLTHLRLAFSRDQKEKIYIQHRIAQDGPMLKEWMLDSEHGSQGVGGGSFYLCGPTWPVPDVRDALVNAFSADGDIPLDAAAELLEDLKERERYILEVY
ncbi:hypothetical protein HKX48_005577 [Thoreauomyces humboldtii]|nr:hypothetical protein HKX48_005577 [Thoreauomyces humboldtii]